jgi:site-specific DNA-cytosine methylase
VLVVLQANRNGGKNDKANNEKSFLFVKAVLLFRCQTACFENVTGMLDTKNVSHVKKIMAELLLNEYQVRLGGK